MGVLVCSFGIAAFGFYWYHWGDGTPALPEGSLIVNINTATREQIDTVPGIGPIGAMQIISNRPYATVDQLERVHGIVPHQVDEMRPYIKVNGPTEPY